MDSVFLMLLALVFSVFCAYGLGNNATHLFLGKLGDSAVTDSIQVNALGFLAGMLAFGAPLFYAVIVGGKRRRFLGMRAVGLRWPTAILYGAAFVAGIMRFFP